MKPTVIGASVKGASHFRTETECQDSWKKVTCDNGTVIMAVADGHGSRSCPYSKTGSVIAVNTFCKIMSEYVENYSESPDALLTFLNREGDTKVAQAVDNEWKKRVKKIHSNNKRNIPIDNNSKNDMSQVYSQYGTTLLGLLLADGFLFAFQIGDGDIVYVSSNTVEPVVEGDRILGVETHSLSRKDAWEKAISAVRRIDYCDNLPSMFLMSSDGFSNSFKNEEVFLKTCQEYFNTINQYGTEAVDENLKNWLTETSALGCGDDITVLMAYFSSENDDEEPDEAPTEEADVTEDKECEIVTDE